MLSDKIINLDTLERFYNNLKASGLPLNIWESSKSYKVGYTVLYNRILYRCKTNTSDAVFDVSKWDPVSHEVIKDWDSGVVYSPYDVVLNDSCLCICTTVHTSSSDFYLDESNWLVITAGRNGGLRQVTKLSVTSPLSINIQVPKTAKFDAPPVEILKLDGTSATMSTNIFNFSSGDGSNFNVNDEVASASEDISFSGKAMLNNEFNYHFSQCTQLDASNYIFESDEVDLARFKSVIEVRLV